jgi:hypothetical protein
MNTRKTFACMLVMLAALWYLEALAYDTCDASNPVVPCNSSTFTANTYIAGANYPASSNDWAVFYDSHIAPVHNNGNGYYSVGESSGPNYIVDVWHGGGQGHYGEAYSVDIGSPPSTWTGVGRTFLIRRYLRR